MTHSPRANGIAIPRRLSLPQSSSPKPASGRAKPLIPTPRVLTSPVVPSGLGARSTTPHSQNFSYEPPLSCAQSSSGSLPGGNNPAAAQILRATSESGTFVDCDAGMALGAFQRNIEEHQRQQGALLASMSAQWEERFSAMEQGLRREIDEAADGILQMKERFEKFVRLAEVLEEAVSKALRTCKDVAHLSREVQRIGETVSYLAQEFSNDRASHCRTCPPRLSLCILDSQNSARSLQEGLQSSNETGRIRELLHTTNEHLLRASRELTTTVNTSGIKHCGGISAEYAHRLESLTNELRGELACNVSQTEANGKPLPMSDWTPSESTSTLHTSFAEVDLTDDQELHLQGCSLSVDGGTGSATPPQHGSTVQFVPESSEPRNVSASLAANSGTCDEVSGPSSLGDGACTTANEGLLDVVQRLMCTGENFDQ